MFFAKWGAERRQLNSLNQIRHMCFTATDKKTGDSVDGTVLDFFDTKLLDNDCGFADVRFADTPLSKLPLLANAPSGSAAVLRRAFENICDGHIVSMRCFEHKKSTCGSFWYNEPVTVPLERAIDYAINCIRVTIDPLYEECIANGIYIELVDGYAEKANFQNVTPEKAEIILKLTNMHCPDEDKKYLERYRKYVVEQFGLATGFGNGKIDADQPKISVNAFEYKVPDFRHEDDVAERTEKCPIVTEIKAEYENWKEMRKNEPKTIEYGSTEYYNVVETYMDARRWTSDWNMI